MIFGGCESVPLGIGIGVLILVTIAIGYFVFTADSAKAPESFCGGLDQLCCCSGNETMVGQRPTESDLSHAAMGY